MRTIEECCEAQRDELALWKGNRITHDRDSPKGGGDGWASSWFSRYRIYNKTNRVRVKWRSFAPCARCGVEYYRSRGVSMTTIPGRGTGTEKWCGAKRWNGTRFGRAVPFRDNDHLPFGTYSGVSSASTQLTRRCDLNTV